MNQIKQGYKQTKVGIIPEDWEVVKLGKVTKINPNNKNLPENFIYIDLESVVKGKLLKQNFISKYEAPSRAQRVLKKNDILFQMVRPYQMNNLFFEFDGDYVASTGYAQIRTNQSYKYIFQYIHLKRFVDKVLEKCTGSNYPAINSSDLSDILIILPPLKEQEKIAEILTTWDEAISNVELLILNYELRKKALMQKLLSGEVRFDGFSDKWEEVRLREICKITTGSSNRKDSSESKGEYTFFDRSQDIRTSDIYLFDGEAIIVAGEGQEFIPKYFVGKFDLHQRTYAIMEFKLNCGKFLFYYLYQNRDYFYSQAVGSTVKSLRLPMFQKMKLKLPSLPEQQKIAEVLSLADDEINLLKNELEELKLQKKALMQKLLTGEVRVKV